MSYNNQSVIKKKIPTWNSNKIKYIKNASTHVSANIANFSQRIERAKEEKYYQNSGRYDAEVVKLNARYRERADTSCFSEEVKVLLCSRETRSEGESAPSASRSWFKSSYFPTFRDDRFRASDFAGFSIGRVIIWNYITNNRWFSRVAKVKYFFFFLFYRWEKYWKK